MSAEPRTAATPIDPRTFRGQRWRRCDGGIVAGESMPIYLGAVGRRPLLAQVQASRVGTRIEVSLAFGSVTYTREA